MKVSAKIDYAVRVLLELGLHWPDTNPCQLGQLSRKAGVPQKFLIHILIALKNSGFVHSFRGKMGGYLLADDPEKINVADVVGHLGGLDPFDGQNRKRKYDVVSVLWKEIDERIVENLKKITLEELCNRQRQQIKTLIYDI